MSLNQQDPVTSMNLFPAASGIVMALTWAQATSLTSTIQIWANASPGILPVIKLAMISPEEKLHLLRFGPRTRPGLMQTSSNFSSSGRALTKSQAAFSANVLLFSQAPHVFNVVSVQSSVVKFAYFGSEVFQIAATEDVTTTLLTLCFCAPLSAAKVP